MTPGLYLVPAIAGVIALAAASRRTLRTGASLLGALGSLGLLATSDSLGGWRSTEPTVAAAFAGAACALAFVLVLADPEGRSSTAAQVGIAGSSLILFAAGVWAVPALLFWLVSSLALAATVADSARRATLWLALGLSDAAVAGVVVTAAIDAGSWTMPSIRGWQVPVLAGAAVLRAGAFPLSGQWPIERGANAAAVPLLTGGGLVLAARFMTAPQPVFGGALIVVGVLAGVGAALWRFDMRLVGCFVVAVMFGIVLAVPEALAAGTLSALCAASAVALWPRARGRGRITRGFVLAAIPPTVAFAGIGAAAAISFDRARAVGGVDGVAWTTIASLLPLALATAVALGAMTARREPSDDFEPPAVVATWFVFVLSVVSGLWLGAFVPAGGAALSGSTRALYLVALVVAGVVAARAPRSTEPIAYGGAEVLLSDAVPPRLLRGMAIGLAGLLGAGAVAAALYLTLLGLQQGFLA